MRKTFVGVAAVSVILAISLQAQSGLSSPDWPRWRGPARDGSVAVADVPAAWPTAYAPIWKVDVGEGYASPVLAAGRVFVHARKDPQETITAVDARTGTVVWRQQ